MDSITAPVLLLVEGKDEKDICEILLESIDPNFEQRIDLQHANGGSDLLTSATAIEVLSGFSQLKSIAILVDAEDSPLETSKKWSSFRDDFLRRYPTRQCQILVLPSSQEKGSLETVFLKSLDQATNVIAGCAMGFVSCVGEHGSLSTQARKDKLALVSYINAQTKNPYSRVGLAVKQDSSKKLFDFSHSSFKPLNDFLKILLNV
jgi:hypothetical protein